MPVFRRLRRRFPLASFAFAALAAASRAQPAPDASAEERLKALEARLSRFESAPAPAALSQFNPAVGLALDTLLRAKDSQGQFHFRAAELSLQAPIDPFLKGYAVIAASNGNPAFEIEEAAVQTTALPAGLSLRAGRFFADFGRLGSFHDHELPLAARPPSVEAFLGGENKGDGAELSWLLPISFYGRASLGAYNKLGGENDRRLDRDLKPFDHMTAAGRLTTAVDLGEDHVLEWGGSAAWTPRRSMAEDTAATGAAFGHRTVKNTWRTLVAADLTYRHNPAPGPLYRGLIWGAEVFQNNERRFNPSSRLPTDRVRSWGGYSYAEARTFRRWRQGLLADFTEDLDDPKKLARTVGAFATFDLTERNLLRLQYNRAWYAASGRPGGHEVLLQWTAVLGSHTHWFRNR